MSENVQLAAVPPLDVRGEGWGLALADPSDRTMNRDLCALFSSVRLESALSLTQERDPDFFVLPRLHQGPFATAVGVDDHGQVVGCGTLCVRDGWLSGELIKTGYLCDLRVAPGFRGGRHLARAYRHFMAHVEARFGAELFTTVIFDSNKAAIAALTQRSDKRLDQPIYRPMTPFQMVSVQFTRKKSAPTGPNSRVSSARPEDLGPLTGYLAARAKTRVLGEHLTAERFAERLSLWPGFSLSDFLIARDGDKIVGCLAPWDTAGFKRTRVLGYRGGMLWQKRAFNAAATVMGFPKLPPPGDPFRFVFLTHLEVDGEDPDILRELLLAAYQRLHGQNLHFMSAFIPRGSPLGSAFKGFMTTKTAMTLYAVHRPDSRFADVDLTTRRPGFEMALS
ncbi:MAG TPA: GNAT family N-acetyltransferase [Myxococcota bacterium]|nr:GNAT family N-acetyltransferase [Myxococcota bacterium]